MVKANSADRYLLFRESTKLLVGMLTALTIKNAVALLVFPPNNQGLIGLENVGGDVWLAFFTTITLSLRFFLGNIQYLSVDPDNDPIELVFDVTAILLQSLLLAVISNFVNSQDVFFFYIILLYVIDFVWFLFFDIQAHIRRRARLNPALGLSQINAIAFIVLMANWGYSHGASAFTNGVNAFLTTSHINYWPAFFIVFVNLGVDLILNGKRYLDMSTKVTVEPSKK